MRPGLGTQRGFELLELLKPGAPPSVDVRAPVEFALGSIPGSVNLPVLNDQERAAVGTAYKNDGSEAAIRLGRELVSGEILERRLEAWANHFRANPGAWLYCFRGGLRSRSVQEALAARGVDVPVLAGGFKRARRFMLEALDRVPGGRPFAVVSGFTGSGKTAWLRRLGETHAVCDLERHARHRGSAFGPMGAAQPRQIDFENAIARDFLLFEADGRSAIVVEDESRLIGRLLVPEKLFATMSLAPIFMIESTREERARFLARSYLSESFDLKDGERDAEKIERSRVTVAAALASIQRRLGGAEWKLISEMADRAHAEHAATGLAACHEEWVDRLLLKYYDPLYRFHVEKAQERVVWRGPGEELSVALKKMEPRHLSRT